MIQSDGCNSAEQYLSRLPGSQGRDYSIAYWQAAKQPNDLNLVYAQQKDFVDSSNQFEAGIVYINNLKPSWINVVDISNEMYDIRSSVSVPIQICNYLW